MADAGGGVNMEGKNGYVKDCSSLGPDVIPEGGYRLMPKAVVAKKSTVLKAHGAAKAKPASAELYSTGFYNSMV